MEQGSYLWKEYRKEISLSAGSLSAILGICPYKSRNQLWKEKNGLAKKEVPIREEIMYGVREEPFARERFEEIMNVKVGQIGTMSYFKKMVGFKASPDGLFLLDGVLNGLEIKNPAKKDIPFSVEQLAVHYYPQVIANQEVFEVETWYLFFNRRVTKEYALFKFTRNPQFWDTTIMPKIWEFSKRKTEFPRMNSKEKAYLENLIKSNVKVELVDSNKGIDLY